MSARALNASLELPPDSRLSAQCRDLLHILAWRADRKTGTVWYHPDKLAAQLGMRNPDDRDVRRNVRQHLKVLVVCGYLADLGPHEGQTKVPKNRQTNCYLILFDRPGWEPSGKGWPEP